MDTPDFDGSKTDVKQDRDSADSKAALRRQFRASRKQRERRQRQTDAARLNQHLLGIELLGSSACVAGYLAFDGEPDIRFTLTQLCRRGVGVALPVMPDAPDDGLRFQRWTPATPLFVNHLGVSEPRAGEIVALEDIDALLLPLVAFDRQGNRLGMGAGWYDRTLSAPECRATRIGVAWSQQEFPQLPVDDWDQPLDIVVTQQGWFTCSP